MKYIEKVDIQYFRSLKDSKIKDLKELNIFSGKNDSGKSNVLKAFDLFFNSKDTNFLLDYNKERLQEVRSESVKGKQYISIKIHFLNPGGFSSLPAKFYMVRVWDRTGKIVTEKHNLKQQFDAGKIKSKSYNRCLGGLTKFLNRIEYTYVPAVKDERFFYYLLELLQRILFEKSRKKTISTIDSITGEFNAELNSITNDLSNEFQQITGIDSTLNFPTEIAELFQRLIIDTKSGNHQIPLQNRGEGIRMRYIPTILNYISRNSKNFHIWGFDEPENSCEYSLAKELASTFANEYTKNSQIFVVTHSFHFISLANEKISRFRVYKDENGISSKVVFLDKKNLEELESELGIIQINEKLAELYSSFVKEREEIKIIKSKLEESSKPFLIFEGPSDNQLFSTAYKSLKNKEITNDYLLCEHQTNSNGSTVGSNAPDINKYLHNHITKTPIENKIIAIFDYDNEGFNEFKALKKSNIYTSFTLDGITFKNVLQHKDKKNVFAITLVPPPFRAIYVHPDHSNYCYLTTELLLDDSIIPVANKVYPTLFDKSVFSFHGKKVSFAQKINEKAVNGDTIDFSGFNGTLELIKKLAKLTN
jgi:AAA15 family ATPase/GTPase